MVSVKGKRVEIFCEAKNTTRPLTDTKTASLALFGAVRGVLGGRDAPPYWRSISLDCFFSYPGATAPGFTSFVASGAGAAASVPALSILETLNIARSALRVSGFGRICLQAVDLPAACSTRPSPLSAAACAWLDPGSSWFWIHL